tara:strand:+ start:819 stop:1523 length:705 start_codon:yes stop_codon:yes gene_type:complete
MLLNADVQALEWVCAAYLSQDKTAITEILNKVDQHTDNQERFKLPTRLIAKTFVFRLIYGGSAYSYGMDNNFKDIGNEHFWQKVIDQFYDKYTGLKAWHKELEDTVKQQMYLEMPTGRRYYYQPEFNSQGKPRLPRTRILNYPVQGLGADLMSIARVSLANRLRGKNSLKLVNTVHDSIMIDYDEGVNDTDELISVVTSAFEDVPKNFNKLFGKEFNLPIRVDVQVGSNWGELN